MGIWLCNGSEPESPKNHNEQPGKGNQPVENHDAGADPSNTDGSNKGKNDQEQSTKSKANRTSKILAGVPLTRMLSVQIKPACTRYSRTFNVCPGTCTGWMITMKHETTRIGVLIG